MINSTQNGPASSSGCQHKNTQTSENAAGGPLVKVEPACEPLDFEQFLIRLDDVEWCSNVILQNLSLSDGSAYKKSKALYQEGLEKLKASRFKNSEDAMNSLRIVLKRAFGCLSVESKGKKADTSQRIVCIKAKIKQKSQAPLH